MMSLYRIRHPECCQCAGTRRPFFEGWFFKAEDASGHHVLSLIPGISRQEKGTPIQPFIQGIVEDRSFFIPFEPDTFSYSQRPFGIAIGPNHFSLTEMHLELSGPISLTGTLGFSGCIPLQTSPLSPGIMGPLSYLPFMECRHGLLCLDADVTGALSLDGHELPFDKGRAYMEKDWGHSFPPSYLWVQSNRFSQEGVSLVCAAAAIPYLGRHFTGIFAVLHTPARQYRIATYRGGRLMDLQQTRKGVCLHMASPRYRLSVTAQAAPGVMLKAPAKGDMSRTITESLRAVTHVALTDPRGRVLFQDTGRNTGLEICEPLPHPL
mgnify:CR=1 FL=1